MVLLDVVDQQWHGRDLVSGRGEVLLQMLRMGLDEQNSPNAQDVVQDLWEALADNRDSRTILPIGPGIRHVRKGNVGSPRMRVVDRVQECKELNQIVVDGRVLGMQ